MVLSSTKVIKSERIENNKKDVKKILFINAFVVFDLNYDIFVKSTLNKIFF